MKQWFKIEDVRLSAELEKWQEIDFQENIKMISFHKVTKHGHCRLNIYLTKGTVSTALNHPKSGKTQLYRKKVSNKMLAKLFNDPRTHTGIGYYTKNK